MSANDNAGPPADGIVTTLFVCVTCRRAIDAESDPLGKGPLAGERLLATLAERLVSEGGDLAIEPVACLSNCSRSCSVAVSAPGKWSYVFGEIDPALHADDVLAFARLHAAHAEGVPAWRERPQHLRKSTVARIPPLPSEKPAPDDRQKEPATT